MQKNSVRIALAALLLTAAGALPVRAADEYNLDTMHAGLTFKISHLGLSEVFGTFKSIAGEFKVDTENPANSSFAITIKTDSIDTFNSKRDDHLRSPDFFNVKQFPTITFKSTSVKAAAGGLEVTGDVTMHGETKPLTFTLKGGKTAMFPPGTQRTGYSTEFVLKRSDFGVGSAKFAQALGDEVHINVSFEGTRR
jgi:polyisoprenoid-binding protein YceI